MVECSSYFTSIADKKHYTCKQANEQMYWKNAIKWLVAQINLSIILSACYVLAEDSGTRENGYLRRGLGMADSWFRSEESGDKYFNLRLHWEKGYR